MIMARNQKRQEEEQKRKAKLEADKALKLQKPSSPWTREAWQTARANRKPQPEPHLPVVVCGWMGSVMTPQKLQEMFGHESLPEVASTTTATIWEDEEEAAADAEESNECNGEEDEADHQGSNSKRKRVVVRYSHLKRSEVNMVKQHSHGQWVTVWFQGDKRSAWLPISLKQPPGKDGGEGV
jgi:hypothetical protein